MLEFVDNHTKNQREYTELVFWFKRATQCTTTNCKLDIKNQWITYMGLRFRTLCPRAQQVHYSPVASGFLNPGS